jgi:hypothetical protein
MVVRITFSTPPPDSSIPPSDDGADGRPIDNHVMQR